MPRLGQRKPLAERFWSKVNHNGSVPAHCPELGQCWQWTGAVSEGYGTLSDETSAVQKAHRVAWYLTTGEWPIIHVCHKCDNPLCVRFSHLFLGDDQANMDDMYRKGRSKHAQGSQVTISVFTESQVLDIKKALAKGASCVILAEVHGVTYRTIYLIKTNQTWKHVTL